MSRMEELVAFDNLGWHKGFYNADDIMEMLIGIRYEDYYNYPDDDMFPYDSAHSFLRGSCNHFAVALQRVLGYTPYVIEEVDGNGFHAFCQFYKKGTLYYVDARGITTSFDEFMMVAREFVTGEYIIRTATQADIDEWETGSVYNDEAYSFAETIIRKYSGCYTL